MAHMALRLVLEPRKTALRRAAGVATSLCLHLLAAALVVWLGATPVTPLVAPDQPLQTIAAIVVPPPTPPAAADHVLTPEPETTGGGNSEQVPMGGVDIDIAKVRARRATLFPFLTLDLLFLEALPVEARAVSSTLTNPFAATRPTAAPPLALTDAAFQDVVDRAWSRRERWRAFAEIAALVDGHDADLGRAPALLRAYLDQNILQPFCDDAMRDPRFWAMLDNAADHADFIDFVRAYARRHPSSRSTTELLFLLDELLEASRDVLLMLLDTKPNLDLRYTARTSREAFDLAVWIRTHYLTWLTNHGIDSAAAIRARHDDLRLRLLATIVESTPDGYRADDARYLAGTVHFAQKRVADATRWWRAITPDARDTYAEAYTAVLQETRRPTGPDVPAIARALQNEHGRWRLFNVDRLRHFGYSCSTF